MSSAATEPTQRLFFALWPPGAVCNAIDRFSRHAIRKQARRVPADKLHITLAFAGPVTAAVRDCLVDGADRIHAEPFEMQLDTVGYWPRPRVLWSAPEKTRK